MYIYVFTKYTYVYTYTHLVLINLNTKFFEGIVGARTIDTPSAIDVEQIKLLAKMFGAQFDCLRLFQDQHLFS